MLPNACNFFGISDWNRFFVCAFAYDGENARLDTEGSDDDGLDDDWMDIDGRVSRLTVKRHTKTPRPLKQLDDGCRRLWVELQIKRSPHSLYVTLPTARPSATYMHVRATEQRRVLGLDLSRCCGCWRRRSCFPIRSWPWLLTSELQNLFKNANFHDEYFNMSIMMKLNHYKNSYC